MKRSEKIRILEDIVEVEKSAMLLSRKLSKSVGLFSRKAGISKILTTSIMIRSMMMMFVRLSVW